jgi:hypothetical protein
MSLRTLMLSRKALGGRSGSSDEKPKKESTAIGQPVGPGTVAQQHLGLAPNHSA